MSERRLLRKLRALQGGYPMSAAAGYVGAPVDPREALSEELERRRTYLAEELLKILAEDVEWSSTEAIASEAAGDLAALAKAAKAAAAEIYPELDEEPQTGEGGGGETREIPMPTREGMLSVAQGLGDDEGKQWKEERG